MRPHLKKKEGKKEEIFYTWHTESTQEMVADQ